MDMNTKNRNNRPQDSDEELVVQYLQEQITDIPDNGFSERVAQAIRHQPAARQARIVVLNRRWTALCAVVALVLLLNVPLDVQFLNAAQLLATQSTALVARLSSNHFSLLPILVSALVLYYIFLFDLLSDLHRTQQAQILWDSRRGDLAE